MYLFELHDILFAFKFINSPTIQFNITNYINISSTSTRSGANNKLILPHHLNNTSRHSYFHRLPSLWNTMPMFDLDMTFNKLKSKLKQYYGNTSRIILMSTITVPYIISVLAQDVTNPNLPLLT